MQLYNSVVGLALASGALASPLQLNNRQYTTSPCAEVSAAVAAQPDAATPTVPAQLAYDCITSVPLNKSAALDLIDSITPYFRWQSNTVWLKDPPKEYAEKVQEGVDVWGGLEDIQSKVESETFKNEFEFGWALYRLLQTTHDGHFVFVPDVIGTVFNWARPVPLVSVSEDGKSLPKPFVYPDILASSFGNASFTPSPISKINGQDALEFLENWSQFGSLQDRDALYNNVFYNLAAVSIGTASTSIGTFAGSGRGRWVYPGAETELEFENGTSVTLQNYARVLVPFDGITDGESLYKTWFVHDKPTETEPEPAPVPSNSTVPTPSATPSATSRPAPGYPPPVVRERDNIIGGYYLEDDYSDIAVLSVPSFVSSQEEVGRFQEVGEQFLAAARAAGKKKLIIDVSANGGGTILQGYDLYKQLFPKGIGHAAGDRFRAFESTDLLGQKYSEVAGTLPYELISPDDNETLYTLVSEVSASIFNYRTDVDENDENFSSWDDKFGPVELNGDNFTNIIHWNLSDELIPWSSGGIYIHGYGNLTNFTQPFEAEDIVVVTDGYCASTCTIFSELMRQRQGVKYISLGGRSKEGITQAIGGVKGTNNYPWSYIQFLAQFGIQNISTPEEGATLNETQLGEYWSETPFDRAAIGSSINVNFRDGWRDDGDYDYPLQFLWEPSDCRIYYTKEMTYDVTAIWKAVADTTWGEDSHCVAGDLGAGGKNKREMRRSLTAEDIAHSSRMHAWKRSLEVADYPLDLFTDMRLHKINSKGFMFP
ncbi:peptidase S41 family protein-like protein [Aaosphaeria arxii CBS 175.79]|uniref:Peptidase S41 family protein-like protein n=1 Tax=Aaosphaeria arxii CBS 175.79 TaxID=1450172 RepID=A0A6A5YA39_9PLEO|nr:peptidase S41 family protein-like protein [Aaosphaeria arxii CBS 175.79]KAF2022116.1 peptidase S41 family protein-like protein [Aaosphaeria arxii CBS 175.79]